MSRFTQALLVTPMADGDTWIVVGDFGYEIGQPGSGNFVEVAAGFQTDFASIPRVFWWVLPKWGKYGNASVIHDWLYWEQARERKEADDIFLEGMGCLKVSGLKKFLMYWAVRIFGGIAWYRNKADRRAGYSRVGTVHDVKARTESQRPGTVKRIVTQAMARSK